MYKKLLVIFIFVVGVLVASNVFGAVYVPPSPAPILNLYADSYSITQYTLNGIPQTADNIYWSTAYATSCAASGGWSGIKDTLGTVTVYPTATTTYSMTCTGRGGSITKSITISATNIIIPPGQACQNPGPAADDYNWVLLFQNCQKAGSYGSNSCNWSGGICNSNNVNKTGKYEEYSGPSNDITYCSTGYVCRYTAPAPTLNLTASPVSPITAGSSGTSNIQVVSSNFATGIDIDTFSNNTGATLGYPLSVSRNGTTSFTLSIQQPTQNGTITITGSGIGLDGTPKSVSATISVTVTRPPGTCSNPMTAYNCATGTSINNAVSYSGLNSNYTWNCSTSGGTSTQCSQTKVMSGTLSSPDCTIASGGSSCNVTATWSITNPQTTPTAITASGMSNINVTPPSGSQSVTVPYPSRTFYLYNNAQLLAQDLQQATCISGTSWNGTKCAPITYTLTINKAGTGSGTVTGAGIYNYNTPVTVSASASVGSTFGGWSGDCSGTSSSTSVTMTSNKTCTATFNLNSYTVTPSATNCSISPSTPQTVSYGSTASFTVTPNAGYTASVTGCGGSLSGTTYTTTTISSNCSVTATCNQMYGTLTPSNQTCYVPLNGSSCTNVPLSWTTTNPVGTSAVTNNGGATPASPTGNNSSASFTVPYKASGVSFYLYNNAIQLATAVVNTVCSSGAWNSSVGACKQYTQYTLTYTAGTGGTISGTTPQTVDYGANGTAVTAVPNSGYSFTSWSDGTSTATRTDTNITANKSVTSTFTLSSCSNGANNPPTCTAIMTGTLTGPASCTIPSGGNTCSPSPTLNWTLNNPIGTPTAITASGMSDINVSNTLTTPQSGTQSVTVPYNNGNGRIFYLYNNAQLLNLPAGLTINANCVSGTSWNTNGSNTCVTIPPPTPTASISVSPSSVASGGAVTITWSSSNATTCSGGTGFNTGGATSGTVTVNPTSNTTYELSCDNGIVVATSSASVTITSGTGKKPIFKED